MRTKENETKLNESAEEDEDEEEDNASYDEVLSQSGTIKEISAPYSVPHYPIELEEQRKQMALKELEEKDFTFGRRSEYCLYYLCLSDQTLHQSYLTIQLMEFGGMSNSLDVDYNNN